MKIERYALFLVIFTALMAPASADLVSNSEEWKDTSLVIAKSHFEDEEVHAVTSLTEGQVIADILADNESHSIYEPTESDRAVWEEYGNTLGERGLENVETFPLSWQESQYDFYSQHSGEVEGIVVLRPKFAKDTISIFPKIINENYWPIYYDGEATEEFLQSQLDDEDVVFYGEFIEKPWKVLPERNDHSFVSEGSKTANNVALVNQITEDHKKSTLTIAGDSYLESGFLKEGDPILVAEEVEQAANVINENNYDAVELIGGENVDFGDSIQERIDNETTVIAKFGRRFTGVQGLESTYPVKKIPAKEVVRQITVDSVKVAEETDTVEVVFDNEGTINTPVTFTALSLTNENDEEIISSEREVVMRPERRTTIHFNSSVGFEPENAELSFSYKGSSGVNTRNYDVELVDRWEASEIELKEFYYDKYRNQIRIELMNTGEDSVYAGAHIMGLELINRSFNPVTEEINELQPGSVERLSIRTRMNKQDIENNSQLNLFVTAGDSQGTAKDLYTFESELEVREGGVVVIVIEYGPIILLVLLILLIIYYWRKRRKQKKYRGLR